MRFSSTVTCLGILLLGAVMFPSFVMAGDYTDAVIASNPLSYWRFDDASTDYLQTAADEQGNNPGSYYFGVSQVTGAPINDTSNLAGYFDMGYVDVGTLPGFGSAMSTGVTVEMWVQSTQTNEGIVFGLGARQIINSLLTLMNNQTVPRMMTTFACSGEAMTCKPMVEQIAIPTSPMAIGTIWQLPILVNKVMEISRCISLPLVMKLRRIMVERSFPMR